MVAWLLLVACTDAGSGRGAPPYQPSAGDEGGSAATLDVDPLETSGVFPEEGEGGDEGFACNAEDVQACPCPDGPGMGVQSCEDGLWGPCMCDDGESTTSADSADQETGAPAENTGDVESTGEPPATEVCFPGADEQYTTCLTLHAFDPDAPPDGYAYPDPIGGDANYRRPIAFIDLEAEDPALALAPNFTLGEFAQAYKGRWGIVQPHAVEAVQALRDAMGPLEVNSGYRSPDYNASIGGAGSSRHMYGDGFDLDPVDVSIAALEAACEGGGGVLVEYETHVHCDWRDDDVDDAFFGPAGAAAPAAPSPAYSPFVATLHHSGRVFWTTFSGFDEGMPVLRWAASDASGRERLVARGPMFVSPSDAVSVRVTIGGALVRELAGAW